MGSPRLQTERLELFPLPPVAAAALPDDRGAAAAAIGAELSPDWPAVDLLDVLPMQAAASVEQARFGIWVIVERSTRRVVGDIGFLGAPGADGSVEIGYSIVIDRRRRGYATEAARAVVAWALEQTGVEAVVAQCAPDNEASVRTLERAGFTRAAATEGRLRWHIGPPH